MNNKNIISISFLILSIAVFYFLVVYMPNKNETDDNQLSIACQEAAIRLHQRDGAEMPQGQFQMEPRYKYDADLEKCLYKGGFISDNSISEYLKDVYTNETLAEYIKIKEGNNWIVRYGNEETFEGILVMFELD